MATENIVWTLLPNGLDRDRDELRSTIFVTPRLRTGGGRERLDVFPSFQHWADTVANLSFVAEVDGLGRFDLALDPDHLGAPDPATWDLLFGGEGVRVDEPEVKDFAGQRLYSYPADAIAQQVLSLYATVGAQHPTEYPSIQDPQLTSLAGDLGRIGDQPADEAGQIGNLFGELNHVPRSVVKTRSQSFLLANRFYDRYDRDGRLRGRDAYKEPGEPAPGPDRPFLDFHSYVAALGDYPARMRRL